MRVFLTGIVKNITDYGVLWTKMQTVKLIKVQIKLFGGLIKMKFRLQTEVNSSGNLVFSKERYGKGFMYLAFDNNGNSRPVTKDWIIQNKDEIENLRVSGDTIAAVQTKKKIEDFGEKIGGAKKDFFTNRKISISALNQLSLTEREKYLTKSKLWPSIDVEEMLNNGFDKTMIYYIRLIRKYMPTKPTYTSKDFDNVKKTQEIFIEFYEAIQSATYKYKSRKADGSVDAKIDLPDGVSIAE